MADIIVTTPMFLMREAAEEAADARANPRSVTRMGNLAGFATTLMT